MIKMIKAIPILFILLNLINSVSAEDTFFEKGKIKYNEKKYKESKFLFQRSIVFNPKDQNSYLYLAKFTIRKITTEKSKKILTLYFC